MPTSVMPDSTSRVHPWHAGRQLAAAGGLLSPSAGRALARPLAAEAHRVHPAVFLRLHPGNAAALACYRAASFTRLDPDTERDWNQAQPTTYLWMTHES